MIDHLSSMEALAGLKQHYDTSYLAEKHDSPDGSRVALGQKMMEALKQGIPTPWILDVGSGRQSVEKEFMAPRQRRYGDFLDKFKFATLDIAKIPRRNLLARKLGVEHTRASGLALPYPDGQMGLVFSNHAIDFLPDEVYDEVARVLAPEGKVIFNFHHPSMLQGLNRMRDKNVKNLWQYLKDNGSLFETETKIRETLASHGLTVDEVKLMKSHRYRL